MQRISLGDREYVKASEAAKKFKYTQDYVGQLCRSDKVDVRLVGRVWYVNLESITEYRKTKHATQKNNAKNVATSSVSAKRSKVEPVLRPKTVRTLNLNPLSRVAVTKPLTASYSNDKVSLIPVLHGKNSKTAETAAGNTAPSKKAPKKIMIKVRPQTKKPTHYAADKIPDIALKSSLSVKDITEKDELEVQKKVTQPSTTQVAAPASFRDRVAPAQPLTANQPAVAVPNKVVEEPVRKTKSSNFKKRAIFCLVSTLLITSVVLLLGLQSSLEVAANEASTSFVFSWDSFQKLAAFLGL